MDNLIERIDRLIPTIYRGNKVDSDVEPLMKELGYKFISGERYPSAEKTLEFLNKKREELNG